MSIAEVALNLEKNTLIFMPKSLFYILDAEIICRKYKEQKNFERIAK